MSMCNKKCFTCKCGCGNGMTVTALDGLIYFDFVQSKFSSDQFGNFIYQIWERINRKLQHKRVWMHDLCLDNDDLEELLEFLESIDCCNDPVENEAYLALVNGNFLAVISKQSIWKLIRYGYRCYEIVWNKQYRDNFLAKVKER